MHKYLLELWSKDENGNPVKRERFEYFDSEINLQYAYEKYCAEGIYCIYLSESRYIQISDPYALFNRVRG